MPAGAKRASHIDPPTSPSSIMRRACPYREENRGPGKEVQGSKVEWSFTESLTQDPELENSQGQARPSEQCLHESSSNPSSRGHAPLLTAQPSRANARTEQPNEQDGPAVPVAFNPEWVRCRTWRNILAAYATETDVKACALLWLWLWRIYPTISPPAQPFALTAIPLASSRFRLGCMPRRDCIVYLDVKKLRRQ